VLSVHALAIQSSELYSRARFWWRVFHFCEGNQTRVKKISTSEGLQLPPCCSPCFFPHHLKLIVLSDTISPKAQLRVPLRPQVAILYLIFANGVRFTQLFLRQCIAF